MKRKGAVVARSAAVDNLPRREATAVHKSVGRMYADCPWTYAWRRERTGYPWPLIFADPKAHLLLASRGSQGPHASRPRSIAARAGVVASAGQRGPCGAAHRPCAYSVHEMGDLFYGQAYSSDR